MKQNSVSLYYLQQMGIDTWLLREPDRSARAIYLLTPESMNPQTTQLFRYILFYLGLEKTQYQTRRHIGGIPKHKADKKNIVLNFTNDPISATEAYELFDVTALEQLIKAPKLKKDCMLLLAKVKDVIPKL